MLTSLGKEVPVTVEVEEDSGSDSADEDDASDSGEGEETEPIERKPEVPALHACSY